MQDKLKALIGEHVNVRFPDCIYGGILTATSFPDMFRVVAGLEYRCIYTPRVTNVTGNEVTHA